MKFDRKILSVAFLILCINSGTSLVAQTTDPNDVKFLLSLKEELSLSNQQFDFIDSLFFNASERINQLSKEIQSISRSDKSEDERSALIRDLNGQKKTIRESRDLSVQLILTDDQKKIYSGKIKPASAPSVIHMGMNHDRANCNICVQ